MRSKFFFHGKSMSVTADGYILEVGVVFPELLYTMGAFIGCRI